MSHQGACSFSALDYSGKGHRMVRFEESCAVPKRVVFVCDRNSDLSQMAEAFVRIYGKGRIQAFSAGVNATDSISPTVVEAMHEIGCSMLGQHSKALSDIPNVEYDMVVNMQDGMQHPPIKAKSREEWDIPDPTGQTLIQIRALRFLIASRVKGLIASLGQR